MKYSDLDIDRQRCLVEFIKTQAIATALLAEEIQEDCKAVSLQLTMQIKTAMQSMTDTEVRTFVSELDHLFETQSVIPIPIVGGMIDNTMN